MWRPISVLFRGRLWSGYGLAAVLLGCGGDAPSPAKNPAAATSSSPAPSRNDVRSRLQGTWELVTFISRGPIPEEAIPVLATLHGAVRLRFEQGRLITFIPGNPDQEECAFEIASENEGSFALVTSAGMFRRAAARFVSDEEWEATEDGPTWPGTTRFRRVRE
ncbi:MAG: hypothetical protein U0441_10680 [Polyangiaceae bacterium]